MTGTGKRIPPIDLSYDQFPHSVVASVGMVVRDADREPRRATSVLGVEYAVKDGHPLHLQLLLPRYPISLDSTQTFPVVAFVQGSAWFAQPLGASLPTLARFAERGYVVAIIEYRPSPVAPFPAQVRDVRTAIGFLRDRADDFHIDPDKLILWGDSSGGHTAVLAYLTDGLPEFADEPGGRVDALCCVDYYGPVDIARMNEEPSTLDHDAPDSPEGMLIGGRRVSDSPDHVAPTVATNYVTPPGRETPVLIIHGSKDRAVPFGQSVLLFDALKDANQPVALYQLRGADHGDASFWQDDIFDLVEEFIRAHL